MARGERLIVEDSEDARNQAIKVTAIWGITPVAVTSVSEALKKLEPPEETFDDIVTDGNLQDGNCTDIVTAATNKVPPIRVIIWSNDKELGEGLALHHKQQGHDVRFVNKGREELTALMRLK